MMHGQKNFKLDKITLYINNNLYREWRNEISLW